MHFSSFCQKFPNNDSCLEVIKNIKFPNGISCKTCDKVTTFYKVKGRPLYACSCGYQVSPLKGTIFESSHVALTDWFFALFSMTSTRCGYSAAQLQRETGVNYKTAWKMLHKIREIMKPHNQKLKGVVEIDETYPSPKWTRRGKTNFEMIPTAIIFGMVEREGNAILNHIHDTSRITFLNQIETHIDPSAHLMTDHHRNYMVLRKRGWKHDWVVHQREFVKKDNRFVYTQTIESLWSQFKRGIYGVYRHVKPKYLQRYIDEYTWRYNHRKEPSKMFDLLMEQLVL